MELNFTRECKRLWNKERNIDANPMPITKPFKTKQCLNHYCHNKVSWQWALTKHFCAGNRCVQSIVGVNANVDLQRRCINEELTRHWHNFEEVLNKGYNTKTSPFIEPLSESVNLVDVNEVFTLDFDYYDLLSDEILVQG